MNAFTKFLVRWTKYAMTLVGAIVMFGTGVYFTDYLKSPRGEVLEEFYPSPDGEYVAQNIWKAGVNRFRSYCFSEIYIYPSSLGQPVQGKGQGHRVYVAECRPSVGGFNVPDVQWSGTRSLEFSYYVSGYHKFSAVDKNFDLVRVETRVYW